MNATIECPTCGGGGIVTAWRRGPDAVDDHDTCGECHGVGEIVDPLDVARGVLLRMGIARKTPDIETIERTINALIRDAESNRAEVARLTNERSPDDE